MSWNTPSITEDMVSAAEEAPYLHRYKLRRDTCECTCGWSGKYTDHGRHVVRSSIQAALDVLNDVEEIDDEPCGAETHSWSHYRPEQIDSYWIRCTQLGKHDEHKDSTTGLIWGEV